MALFNDLHKAAYYAAGLRTFWRTPWDASDVPGEVRRALAERNQTFLQVMRLAVFANPASPYLHLLQEAHIDEPQVSELVQSHGIEGALRRLFEAGVYVTLDEFKGRKPLRRSGREFLITPNSFDNPQASAHVVSTSGGTRSQGTRLVVDLSDMVPELRARYLFLRAHDLLRRPYSLWRPAPPAVAALKNVLCTAKLGVRPLRWFSQTHPGVTSTGGKSAYLTWCTTWVSRLMGHRIPWPEYVPIDHAEVVARWLADLTARGESVHLDVIVSSGVRICQVARELGLDISGHAFRTNSEPLTEAKAALFHAAGLYVCSMYGMTESGMLGVSCGDPVRVDDMHLLRHRMAIVQDQRTLPGWPEPIGAILLSVFALRMTKVMLNVEVGDYGIIEQRQCGCVLGEAGLDWHLHTIRSYEKLTSAGMQFMGTDLIDVLESALPRHFGGGPTDYQFVEDEVAGETILKLVAAPSIGPLDEEEVIAFVLDDLRRRTATGRLMTDIWRDSRLLRLERAEPYVTGVGKVQALHVVNKR